MHQWLLYSLIVAGAAILMPLLAGQLAVWTGVFEEDREAAPVSALDEAPEAFEIPSAEPGSDAA